jgi:hypothetical protein
MFDRKLTDTAGGNISVRAGDHVCITPVMPGASTSGGCARQVWLPTWKGTNWEGEGDISREPRCIMLFENLPESARLYMGMPKNLWFFVRPTNHAAGCGSHSEIWVIKVKPLCYSAFRRVGRQSTGRFCRPG